MENMSNGQGSPSRRPQPRRPEPRTPTSSSGPRFPFPSSPPVPYHHESLQNQDEFQGQGDNKQVLQLEDQFALEEPDLPKSPRDLKREIGPWKLGVTLGVGASGRVRKARHAVTGQVAAVKIISKAVAATMRSDSVVKMSATLAPVEGDTKFLPFGLEREIVILKLINHPNIVKLYDLWENRGELYIVLEHVEGGELFDYIVQRGRIEERDAFRIFRQILGAVHYCHVFRICHRDIKPENVIVDAIGNIKLIDFGMASREHIGGLSTSCGSPHYTPPEIAFEDNYIGSQADIWSCGVVLYVMLTGELPFAAGIPPNDIQSILLEIATVEPDYSRHLSEMAQDILRHMFRKNPSNRVPAELLWRHPIMVEYEEIGKNARDKHRWIGGPPVPLTTADCGSPMIRAEIDRDLLSGLCIFWQVVNPEEMIDKLTDPRPNYEKVIYRNLFNFRKEQEENYSGVTLEHKESDVHHVQRRPIRTQSRMFMQGHRRRVPSVISIRQRLLPEGYRMPGISSSSSPIRGADLGASHPQSEEHAHSTAVPSNSKFTIAGPPARSASVRTQTGQQSSRRRSQKSQTTDKSYDPFRASSTSKPSAEADHAKVTVIGNNLPRSRHGYVDYTASLRRPAIKAPDSEKFSMQSSPRSFVREIQSKNRSTRHPNARRLRSDTSSWASTGMSSSSTRQFSVPAIKGRRVLRISTTKPREPPPPRPHNPTPLSKKQGFVNDPTAKNNASSSPTKSITTRRRARPRTAEDKGKAPMRMTPPHGSRRSSTVWEERTRQASVELSELMDEVFADEPIDSALWKETTEQQKQDEFIKRSFDLPGLRETGYSRQAMVLDTKKLEARSPSDGPARLKSIYDADSAAELIEVKRSLQLRAQDLGTSSLDPVIGHIDRLLAGQPPSFSRRIASAPGPSRKQEDLRSMPPLPEEDEELRRIPSPIKGKPGILKGKKSTVRLVDDDDIPMRPDPVKLKKVQKKVSLPWLGSSRAGASSSTLDRFFKRNLSEPHVVVTSTSNEDQNEGQGRRNWFRRSSHATSKVNLAVDDSGADQGIVKDERTRDDANTMSDDLPFRLPKRETTTAKMVRFLKRQPKDDRMQIALPGDDEANWYDSASESTRSIQGRNRIGSHISINTERTPNVGRHLPRATSPHLLSSTQPKESRFQQSTGTNLFARLFNIPTRQAAPTPYHICLHLPRITAIGEIKAILRSWRAYGVSEIQVNRQSGIICASVGEQNAFGILPVAIVVAVHAVAVNGNAGGLSIAKITAQWGNRSSFNEACQSIERVLHVRGLVVMEKHIIVEMKKALRNWERL